MKIELEQTDLQRIADMVAERLLPILKSTNALENGVAEDQLLDVPGLCRYMSVSERWVRDKVSQKSIPYYRVGGILRFKRNEIDGYMKTRRNN